MDVGMPACGQGQLEMVRKARAQHANLAWACNVDQIGLKALQNFADERNMAQKGRIEAQVFFQGKGEKAARQLQGPYTAVLENGLRAVSGANAEKRQIAPPGKRLKMAAGMRNPIHLMEGVGEVRHARHLYAHELAVVLTQRQPQLVRLAPRHAQPARNQ